MRSSYESGAQPLSSSHHRYESTSNNEYNNDFKPRKHGISPWVKFGVPVLVVVIIGAVVGGVLGTRHSGASSSDSGSGSGGSPAAQSSKAAASAKNELGVFYTATDAYGQPVYPMTTNAAAFASPTFNPSASATWPADPYSFTNPTPTSVRPDRPRIIAPSYKWDALPQLIRSDPYLREWNDTIFGNASVILAADPLLYAIDGGLAGSGVLDVARETKVRIKTLAYAYRLSNDTKWADRAFRELQNAAGNTSNPFGTAPDRWNTLHFLDVGEFTAAFAIGYDWLYDYWTPSQRNDIMWSILNLGLNYGIAAYTDPNSYFGWWRNNVNGNWNCVCNGGLTLGALAILNDDPTGTATQMLSLTIPNAKQNCVFGPSTDGTWSETPNYWYFGTTGHAEMTSALMTATGSDYGMLSTNTNFNLTALYHMYVTGMTSLFNYGDHGPNKFSTTANGMMFYGTQYKTPQYTLFQRDRIDAPEPHAMFWYDPSVAGAWWNNLPLDHYFDNGLDQWASMRSSWTDDTGLYVAIKSGNHTGHQAHGDLDAGDFVLDAMGERWAGELGSGDYLSTGYFSNETQTSDRWLYYRKRTEGQNTIVVNEQNQNVIAQPTCKYGSSGTAQGSSTAFTVPSDSTAFFTTDLTSSYDGTSVKRGIRMINGRKQVLLQDDISNAATKVQWRMHTNATVNIDSGGTSATLTMPSGKKLVTQILNPASGIAFTKGDAVRYPDDPPLPPNQVDQPNPGVTVLIIDMPAGSYSLQVLFNPQWDGMSADQFKTPSAVAIDSWSLTSHN